MYGLTRVHEESTSIEGQQILIMPQQFLYISNIIFCTNTVLLDLDGHKLIPIVGSAPTTVFYII